MSAPKREKIIHARPEKELPATVPQATDQELQSMPEETPEVEEQPPEDWVDRQNWLISKMTPSSPDRVIINTAGWETEVNSELGDRSNVLSAERFFLGERYVDRINLTSELLFAYDRAAIQADTRRLFERLVESFSQEFSEQHVFIVGHTDTDGPAPYNLRLSAQRAASVVGLFGEYQLPRDNLFVIPAGEHMPIATNNTVEGKAKNRRVEIYVSPWQDMALDFIRDMSCPIESCTYTSLSLLAVDRDYRLNSEVRGETLPAVIMPMQMERDERLVGDGPVRMSAPMVATIRSATLPVRRREVRLLSGEYLVDEDQ